MSSSSNINVEAFTSLGKLRGKRMKIRNENNYYDDDDDDIFGFLRIPYAKPPVRFALPEPHPGWNGETLDCSSKDSTPCVQAMSIVTHSIKVLGHTDNCLFLNIFTPRVPKENEEREANLPVLVWFHGGAFCIGSNDVQIYGPDFLLENKDVVLVTVNYRLGIFGFFSLENNECPGNQGLHDQVMALRWIQNHIRNFGGNPGNVTIMGESAGGMSCLLHLASPLSKDLFKNIICMSGPISYSPFLHTDHSPQVYARKLAQTFGCCYDDTPRRILEKLRSLPATTIAAQTYLFGQWDFMTLIPWKPVIDGSYSDLPFLPESWKTIIESGNGNPVDSILCGNVGHEGLIITGQFHKSKDKWEELFSNWSRWAPELLLSRERENITENDSKFVTEIRSHYFGENEDVKWNQENLKIMERLMTMCYFTYPLIEDCMLLSRHGYSIYGYHFAYNGTMTISDFVRLPLYKMVLNLIGRYCGLHCYQNKTLGTCHGDDLLYLFPFKIFGFPPVIKTDMDLHISQWLVKIVTNVALYGKPDKIGDWKPFELIHPRFMLLDHTTIGTRWKEIQIDTNLRFWKERFSSLIYEKTVPYSIETV